MQKILEERGQFEKRMEKEGRWQVFLERREFYAGLGFTKNAAYWMARAFFLPKGVIGPGGKVGPDYEACEEHLDCVLEDFRDEQELSMPEIIRWVAKHLRVRNVTPAMAPCKEAWTLLQEFRISAERRADFLSKFLTKLIPTKSELSRDDGITDDGRDQFDLIDRIQESRRPQAVPVLSSGAEGL